ncbi:MAG: hypothetical protein L0G99_03975, partial [Propionibacteriales bacterium]|nr:hypothetical protein [Propionibacteriales bacterium]
MSTPTGGDNTPRGPISQTPWSNGLQDLESWDRQNSKSAPPAHRDHPAQQEASRADESAHLSDQPPNDETVPPSNPFGNLAPKRGRGQEPSRGQQYASAPPSSATPQPRRSSTSTPSSAPDARPAWAQPQQPPHQAPRPAWAQPEQSPNQSDHQQVHQPGHPANSQPSDPHTPQGQPSPGQGRAPEQPSPARPTQPSVAAPQQPSAQPGPAPRPNPV